MSSITKDKTKYFKVSAIFLAALFAVMTAFMSTSALEVMEIPTSGNAIDYSAISSSTSTESVNTAVGKKPSDMDLVSVWQKPSSVIADIDPAVTEDTSQSDENVYKYTVSGNTYILNANASGADLGAVGSFTYKNAVKVGPESYDAQLVIKRIRNGSSSDASVFVSKESLKIWSSSPSVFIDFGVRITKNDQQVTPQGTFFSVSLPDGDQVLQVQDLTNEYMASKDMLAESARDDVVVEKTAGPNFGMFITKPTRGSSPSGDLLFNYSNTANSRDEGYLNFAAQSKSTNANSEVLMDVLVTTHKVTFTAGEGVTITGDAQYKADNLSLLKLTDFDIADSYRLKNFTCDKDVTINGRTVTAGTPISSSDIVNVVVGDDINITINASQLLKIEAEVEHGRVTNDASELTDIEFGSSRTVSYEPDEGNYQLVSVTVDGQEVSKETYASSYTFNDMQDDHSIKVVYEKVPKVGISKEATPSNANSHGDAINYTLSISQNEPDASAKNVVVTDKIPDGLTLDGDVTLSGVSGEVNVSGNQITVNIPVLSYSASPSTISYKVKTTKTAGTFTNSASINASNVKTGATSNASVSVGTPALKVTKTAAQASVKRDEDITYTVTLKNSGTAGSEVRDASFVDMLPSSVEFESVESVKVDSDTNASAVKSAITHSNGTIAGNVGSFKDEVVIKYKVKVKAANGVIKNSARANGFIQSTKSGASSNVPIAEASASSTVNIIPPSLSITKSCERDFTYYNDEYTYTVNIKNANAGTYANDFVLSEALSPKSTEIDTESIEVKNKDGQDVVCSKEFNGAADNPSFKIKIDKLSGDIVVTYKVHINAKAGVVASTSTIESPDDTKLPKTKEITVDVKKPIFEMSKATNKKVIDPKGVLKYSITIKESEKVNATNVVFTDKIPEGLVLDETSIKVDGAQPSSVTHEDGVLKVVFDRFMTEATISYSGDVIAEDGGHLINEASLSCDNINETYSSKTDTYVTIDKESEEETSTSHVNNNSKTDSENDANDSATNSSDSKSGSNDKVAKSSDSSSKASSSDDSNAEDESVVRSKAQTGDYIAIGASIALIVAAAAMLVIEVRRRKRK